MLFRMFIRAAVGWLFHKWCIFKGRSESLVFWKLSVCWLSWGNEASLQQSVILATCYKIRHNSRILKCKIIQKELNGSTLVSHSWWNHAYFSNALNIRKWTLLSQPLREQSPQLSTQRVQHVPVFLMQKYSAKKHQNMIFASKENWSA